MSQPRKEIVSKIEPQKEIQIDSLSGEVHSGIVHHGWPGQFVCRPKSEQQQFNEYFVEINKEELGASSKKTF